MLEMIKSSELERASAIERRYPGCMFIMTDLDTSDMCDPSGRLYCVSRSDETYKELMDAYRAIGRRDGSTCVSGLYKRCFAAGLQFVIGKG